VRHIRADLLDNNTYQSIICKLDIIYKLKSDVIKIIIYVQLFNSIAFGHIILRIDDFLITFYNILRGMIFPWKFS